MKAFIRGSTTRLDCCRAHKVGRAMKTVSLGAPLARRRSTTCEVSAISLHIALTSHRPQLTGMRR
jgi:hypothetical protein